MLKKKVEKKFPTFPPRALSPTATRDLRLGKNFKSFPLKHDSFPHWHKSFPPQYDSLLIFNFRCQYC